MKSKVISRNWRKVYSIDGEGIPADSWTTSIQDVPALTHAVVEDFFSQTKDKRHVTEGYAFSKTKQFETSGKPIRLTVIRKNISFINCFLQVCSAILDNKSFTNICDDNHSDKLKVLEGHVPEFENLLALRQWATAVK